MFIAIVKFHKPKGLVRVYSTNSYHRDVAKERVVAQAQADGSEIDRVWVQRAQPTPTARVIWANDQKGGGGSRRAKI